MSYEKIVNDYIKNSTAYKAFLKNQDAILSADTIDYFPLSVLVKAVSDKRGVFLPFPRQKSMQRAYMRTSLL